jgi:hypothetical protein
MSGQRKAFARVVDVGDSARRAEPTTARAPKSFRPPRRRRAKGECSKQYNRISPAFHPIFFQKLSTPCGTSVGPWRALRRKTQIAGDAATRPRRRSTPAKPMKWICRKTALRRSTFVPRKLPNCNLYTNNCVFVPRFTRCSVVSRLRRTRAQTCACTRSSGARLRGRGKKARRPGRLRKRPPDRASRRCPSRRARARGRSRAGRARAPRRRRPRRRRRRPKGAGGRS